MYKIINSTSPNGNLVTTIKRLSDDSLIPISEANNDYQAYLAWLEEGNTPLLAEVNPV